MSELITDKSEINVVIWETGISYRDLSNTEYMKRYATRHNLDETATLEVAAEMVKADDEEYAKKKAAHKERALKIVNEMVEGAKIRKGNVVAMFIGQDDIRIVRVESSRAGKIYGNTVDAFESVYIDEWPVENVITSADQITN